MLEIAVASSRRRQFLASLWEQLVSEELLLLQINDDEWGAYLQRWYQLYDLRKIFTASKFEIVVLHAP